MQCVGGLAGELVVEHIHRLNHVGEMAVVAAVVGAVVGGVCAAEAVLQLAGMDAGELVVTGAILDEAIVVGSHADLLGRVPAARRESECLGVGGAAGAELPAATAGDLLGDRDGHVGRGLAQQGELVGGTFARFLHQHALARGEQHHAGHVVVDDLNRGTVAGTVIAKGVPVA